MINFNPEYSRTPQHVTIKFIKMDKPSTSGNYSPGRNGIRRDLQFMADIFLNEPLHGRPAFLNLRIQLIDGRRVILVPVRNAVQRLDSTNDLERPRPSPPVPDHVDDRNESSGGQTVELSSDMHGAISTTERTQNIQAPESGTPSNTTSSDQSQVTTTQNRTDSPS